MMLPGSTSILPAYAPADWKRVKVSERLDTRLDDYVRRISEVDRGLTITTLRAVAGGQNNDTLIVNETLLFRFPRFVNGVASLQREVELLHRLQGLLPLPIPSPLYAAFTPPLPGYAVMGYPLLPGVPL